MLDQKTYQRVSTAEFQKMIRQFLILSIEDALTLTEPRGVGEFERALQSLKKYDADPTPENRKALKKIHDEMAKDRNEKFKAYWRPVNYVYLGIVDALHHVLVKPNNLQPQVTFYLQEAFNAQVEMLGNPSLSQRMAHVTPERFGKRHDALLAAYRAKYFYGWKEYKAAHRGDCEETVQAVA